MDLGRDGALSGCFWRGWCSIQFFGWKGEKRMGKQSMYSLGG